jgi:type II secretory pathway predicted ATPase ExeA
VWQRHWSLASDPFADLDSPYVSLPSHDEAVARLVYAIEKTERRIVLTAPAGLGKTKVLHRAIDESKTARRRFAVVRSPIDGNHLVRLFAERLGERIGPEPNRYRAWRALERAIRVISLHGFHVVLAVDDWNEPAEDSSVSGRDLEFLTQLSSESTIQLSVILIGRTPTDSAGRLHASGTCPLPITLHRLTRSQVESYLVAKLDAAGCTERIFTPRAATRLHARTSGVPRRVDRLASLCLIAGAVRGLEVISPDVVDGVARECAPGTVGLEGEA